LVSRTRASASSSCSQVNSGKRFRESVDGEPLSEWTVAVPDIEESLADQMSASAPHVHPHIAGRHHLKTIPTGTPSDINSATCLPKNPSISPPVSHYPYFVTLCSTLRRSRPKTPPRRHGVPLTSDGRRYISAMRQPRSVRELAGLAPQATVVWGLLRHTLRHTRSMAPFFAQNWLADLRRSSPRHCWNRAHNSPGRKIPNNKTEVKGRSCHS